MKAENKESCLQTDSAEHEGHAGAQSKDTWTIAEVDGANLMERILSRDTVVFSNRLATLRLNRNLRQSDLARCLHVSTSTISNYEQSIRYPNIELLIQIADYFSVSTDYLLGRTNVRFIARDAAE